MAAANGGGGVMGTVGWTPKAARNRYKSVRQRQAGWDPNQ